MRRKFSLTKEAKARLDKLENAEFFLPNLFKSRCDKNNAGLRMQKVERRRVDNKPADAG